MEEPPPVDPDRRDGWLDAALAEYEAHRQEILAMTQAQHSTLALGVTAIGILAAGAFNVWNEDRVVAPIVFIAVVPLLTSMILVIWASQVVGMFNIGHYLRGLEARIGDAVGDGPGGIMSWEETATKEKIRTRTPTYAWHYVAVIVLFGILTVGSIVLGAYRAWSVYETKAQVGAFVMGGFAVVVFSLVAWAVGTGRNRYRT